GSSDINLAFGDALFLHPNDTNGSPLIPMKLTGTKNYKIWSIAMRLALSNKNKLGFTDNTCKTPAATDPLANQWDMCNSMVLTWILNSISPELYAGQIHSKSPSVVWDDLRETYDKVDGSVTFNLHKSINSLAQNRSALSDYYHKLNSFLKQFDALVSLLECTCSARKHFENSLWHK
ncbi:putative transcription factor interactor and regulator CCHC(Zn) family protein, partial [Tanacetum coccineum]